MSSTSDLDKKKYAQLHLPISNGPFKKLKNKSLVTAGGPSAARNALVRGSCMTIRPHRDPLLLPSSVWQLSGKVKNILSEWPDVSHAISRTFHLFHFFSFFLRYYRSIWLQSQTITLDSGFLSPHTPCPMLFCRFKKISKEKSTALKEGKRGRAFVWRWPETFGRDCIPYIC